MILTLNLGIRGRQKDDSVELEAGEVLVNLRQKFASEVKPSFIYREGIPREQFVARVLEKSGLTQN